MTSPAGSSPPDRLASLFARDIWLRVLSAIVLAGIAIAAIISGPIPFAVLVTAVALVMAWEWSRLVRGTGQDAALVVHGLVIALAAVLATTNHAALALLAVAGGAIAIVTVAYRAQPYLSGLGVVQIGLPLTTLIWLRADETHGAEAVVFVFLVVWATDTAAMVVGRSIGGPKLWPSLSPNKTWAGFFGGLLGAALVGAAFALVLPKVAMATLIAKALLLALACHGGDLAESALKRAFGAKDASNLIPGHGGFLDRLDGFVAAATMAGIIAVASNVQHPGRALLFGQ